MQRLGEVLPAPIRRRIAEGRLTPVEAPYEAAETSEEAAARRAAGEAVRRHRWLARVPSDYATATLDDLSAEQNPRGGVAAWWSSGHRTLLLYSGRPGVGKTHAAYAVGTDALLAGAWAEAWTVTELLMDLRPGGPEDALHRSVSCDLLVLDDLGRESDSDWTRQMIHHVLSTRLAAGRRQVVTTNLSAAEMGARYTDPIVDRLAQDAVIVEVTGSSRRRPARW